MSQTKIDWYGDMAMVMNDEGFRIQMDWYDMESVHGMLHHQI